MTKKLIISILLVFLGYQGSAFYNLRNENVALTESKTKLELQTEYLKSEEFKLKNESDLKVLSEEMAVISEKYAQHRLDLKKHIESFSKKMSVEDKLKKIQEKRDSPEYNEVTKKYFKLEAEIKTVKERELILKSYIDAERKKLDQSQKDLTLKYKKNLFGLIWYLLN